MSLRIAITRALPDAERTAQAIRTRGGEPLIAPLLSIETRAFDTDLGGVQALLFTSAAGVRAFAEASDERARPVLCVGDATAETARARGFQDVRPAAGAAQALTALAAQALDPRAGTLLHVSGADIASDMIGPLSTAGFDAERRIAYEAATAKALPEAFSGPLDVVLFYSARAARAFVALGAPGAASLTAACMSPNVAKAAEPERWKRVIVASSPREDALLDAIFPA